MTKLDLRVLMEYELIGMRSTCLIGWFRPPYWFVRWLSNRAFRIARRKLKAYERFHELSKLLENGATPGHILWKIMKDRKHG